MHAWLFRHRERLRLILGLAAPQRGAERDAIPARGGPAAARPRGRARGPNDATGQVSRRGSLVVLLPMPRVPMPRPRA